MVEEAEETKLCKNCEKQIASSKFRMHEVQCARINYKCKECGMIVAKSDKEEHEANEHVKVKCQHCQFEELSLKFGNHEDQCEKRPRPCRWCNEMQRFAQFQNHEEACAVKTKKCEKCGHFVKNRDWEKHPKGECALKIKENEAKEQAEQQKRMEELQRFQAEEQRRLKEKKEKEAREAKERKERQEREQREAEERARIAAQKKQKPVASMLQPQVKPSSKPVAQSRPVPQPSVAKPSGMPQPKPSAQRSTIVQPAKSKPQSSLPPSVETDEVTAALIAQMMEEDESRLLAEQLQNESYGGSRPNNHGQVVDEWGADVRQADQQQVMRLDGRDEMPRRQQDDWANQTSDDMRMAIQASMEQNYGGARAQGNEDDDLARALELSKNFF